ncbi:type 1 glutamine amidotransferase domain-containing protein [Sphingomicrobium sp. XHP0235]|uniref:type 1 glutamine amidotransferase domain-containing protein n=1 Tax=Sphingomicrobium aquimarinum TaxID=3133971 RepID=UPI0031FEF89E
MRILIVLTSHDELGDTGEKTGFWLEELAAPYYTLKDAGHSLTLASPKGGKPPLDPRSDNEDSQTDATRRFKDDPEAQMALDTTKQLADMRTDNFDAVFFPGGHGPLWDLAADADAKRIIETTLRSGKPVGLVCHAPAILKQVESEDGSPLVKNRKVTGFTNEEEEKVGLTKVVPFLLEDVLKEQGAHWSEGGVFEPHVVADGLLITGQNPPSSAPTAEALLKALEAKETHA